MNGTWSEIVWDDAMLKAARKGLVEAGIIIKDQAVALCPARHGRLRGSITFATASFKSPLQSAVPEGGYEAVNPKSDDRVIDSPDDYTLHVGTNVEYAPYVEYGTRRFPTGQPFLRPALDLMRNNVCKKYAETIGEEIKRRVK